MTILGFSVLTPSGGIGRIIITDYPLYPVAGEMALSLKMIRLLDPDGKLVSQESAAMEKAGEDPGIPSQMVGGQSTNHAELHWQIS